MHKRTPTHKCCCGEKMRARLCVMWWVWKRKHIRECTYNPLSPTNQNSPALSALFWIFHTIFFSFRESDRDWGWEKWRKAKYSHNVIKGFDWSWRVAEPKVNLVSSSLFSLLSFRYSSPSTAHNANVHLQSIYWTLIQQKGKLSDELRKRDEIHTILLIALQQFTFFFVCLACAACFFLLFLRSLSIFSYFSTLILGLFICFSIHSYISFQWASSPHAIHYTPAHVYRLVVLQRRNRKVKKEETLGEWGTQKGSDSPPKFLFWILYRFLFHFSPFVFFFFRCFFLHFYLI